MPGTLHPVNTALSRPLLIAGCEKRLAIVNGLVSFTLVAATYLHFPACLMGVGLSDPHKVCAYAALFSS